VLRRSIAMLLHPQAPSGLSSERARAILGQLLPRRCPHDQGDGVALRPNSAR
jgi:hypothetical protein